MSSDDFSTIISEASIGPPARERLTHVLEEAKAEGKELTFAHLAQEARPLPTEKLALAMAALVQHGLVTRVLRVESPIGGGIGDFNSIEEIPDDLYDSRTDEMFHVRPENILVVYQFKSADRRKD